MSKRRNLKYTDSIHTSKIRWNKLNKVDLQILGLLHKPEIVIVDSGQICEILDISQNVVNRSFKKFIKMNLLGAVKGQDIPEEVRLQIEEELTAEAKQLAKNRTRKDKGSRKRLGF